MSNQHHLYIHRNIANVTIHGEGLDGWEMDAFLQPEIAHENICFLVSKKAYRDLNGGNKSYHPLNIIYEGEYWGEFDWKKMRMHQLDGKGDQSKKIAELMSYLEKLAAGYFSYSVEYTYVEVCCFIERIYRRGVLSILRLADEHYSLNDSEKTRDTAYNGVSEIYISGKLQTLKTEPRFKLKLYEAIRVEPVGFKDGQTPKLEIQIEDFNGSLEAAKIFGVRKLRAILNYCKAETVEAEEVAIDHAGAGSYARILTEGIEGQDNRFVDDLMTYETRADHPEWLEHSPDHQFFLQIYLNGRRSRKELLGTGIPRGRIEKAVRDGILIATGGSGAGGVSYRMSFSMGQTN